MERGAVGSRFSGSGALPVHPAETRRQAQVASRSGAPTPARGSRRQPRSARAGAGWPRAPRSWKGQVSAGGEGGIRTPDTLASMPHFECGAFNHSATSPQRGRRLWRAALDNGGPSRLQGHFADKWQGMNAACPNRTPPWPERCRQSRQSAARSGLFGPVQRLTRQRPSSRDDAHPAWGLPAPVMFLNPRLTKRRPERSPALRQGRPNSAKGKKCSQSSKRAASSIASPPTMC